MAAPFDPYHRWLGIAPQEQPPNHYRLLGIPLYEASPDVIETAADRQIAHLRTFQTGKHGVLSQRLLNEVAAARLCLLTAKKKAAYDAALREKLAASASDDQKEAVDAELIGLGEEDRHPAASRLSKISGSASHAKSKPPMAALYLAGSFGVLFMVVLAAWVFWPSSNSSPHATTPSTESVASKDSRPPEQPSLKPVQVSRPDDSNASAPPVPVTRTTESTPTVAPSPPPFPNAPVLAVAPFDGSQAKRHQEAWGQYLRVPVEVTNSLGMRLVLIPPGEFEMGELDAEIQRLVQAVPASGDSNWMVRHIRYQGPRHRVRISTPFYLGACETTQSLFTRIMATNPSAYSSQGKRSKAVAEEDTRQLPVDSVSWFEADEFCRRLSLLPEERTAGRVYRLPREAEWEYAARSGSAAPYFFGNDDASLGEYAWYSQNSRHRPHPVGGKAANAWGLFDVLGNLWEWTADWLGDYPSDTLTDPSGPRNGSWRVARGGCFGWGNNGTRCTFRHAMAPKDANADFGFRIACDLAWPGRPAPIVRFKLEELGKPGFPAVPEVMENGAVWLDKIIPDKIPKSLQQNRSYDGHALQIGGKTYSRGLGTHAPGEICFALGGRYSRFQAECGVDDEKRGQGTCVFRVTADGTTLLETGVMRGQEPAKSIDLDVRGKQELHLIADDGGDGDRCDHADWAEARLVPAEQPPEVAGSAKPPTSVPGTAAGLPVTAPGSAGDSSVRADSRLPIPDNSAQQQAAKTVAETYQQALQKARTNEDRSALAQRLLEQATKLGDDPAGRFVLLRGACTMAAEASDADTAVKAIDQLNESYQVDAPQMRLEALSAASKKARSPAARKAIADGALAGVDRAILDGRFPAARELLSLAIAEAGRARERELAQRARTRLKEIDEAERDFVSFQGAVSELKQNPDDPGANAIVGRYLCLVLGDWERGLPALARGNDETLSGLARKELAPVDTGDACTALADAWWNLAEKAPPTVRKQLKIRSGYWYQLALASTSGVAKARIEKRIDILRPLLAQQKHPAELLNKTDGSTLILIPAGTFLAGEAKFPVRLPAYYLGLHEVSNAQYKRFLDATGHKPPHDSYDKNPDVVYHFNAGNGNLPVSCVTWQDAVDYCQWAGLRLPTELEWEKGARGVDGRAYPWGERWDRNRCWSHETDGRPSGFNVLSYPDGRSPWGLYNMIGSLAEWCADPWTRDCYDRYQRGDLRLPEAGEGRVIRGESLFTADATRGRCGFRPGPRRAEASSQGVGFRVARSAIP
jgi:formylglycine-generating enzyme required for sulfatase activity